ncbi:MAG TPA: UDP-glucose/GDP-mannose dehydrogenase family protein, partial [Gemmatimonadales bacterium]|nr:UDP-glucose/GDP-mannose dehydrogenase family protein [Gemmatimonadales bacterium]
MRLTVIGSGYVGLVAGACFAETGNDVLCVDRDAERIERLRRSDIPIYEPGLEPMVRRNQADGRLTFTTELGPAVERAEVVFIAVGTPQGEDGSADLSHVIEVAREVGRHMNRPKVVVTKSTVPVGTARRVREVIAAETQVPFQVCANPEFLKEGAAVEDFMRPDRVVIGTDDDGVVDVMSELYAPFTRQGGDRLLFMDTASAELTKYAANAMLATRISFMNEMAALCEATGADVTQVRLGIGSDRRIGRAFLYPGPGFGGSCFPKDLKAIMRVGADAGVPLDLLPAVEAVNDRQKQLLLSRVTTLLGGRLHGAAIAIWGLAFKAETDDVRESPAVPLIEGLLSAGAEVRAHDPKAVASARRVFGDRVRFDADPYDAAAGADALVVVTEWLMYRTPDFVRLKSSLRRPLILDGRNLYDPERLAAAGFEYHGIGRGRP